MTDFTTDRALFACNALVYLAIALGALAVWSDAIAAGGLADYLAAIILTVACTMISFLLSGVVIRIAEAREARAWLTAAGVSVTGILLGLIEGGMTHHGVVWLDARHDLGSPEALFVASFGLSAFNVGGLYFFAREIAKPKPPTAARSLDAAVFGPAPVMPLPVALPAPVDIAPATAATMKDPTLADMVKAIEGAAAARRLAMH